MPQNEKIDNVRHLVAWRSLPEDDLLHASANCTQLRLKRVVRFDARWMRCRWPEELVQRSWT